MITAETMRRIAPKQGDLCAEVLLQYTADKLETEGIAATLLFLQVGSLWSTDDHSRYCAQLLQIMRSPEEINEWTPVGGDTDG